MMHITQHTPDVLWDNRDEILGLAGIATEPRIIAHTKMARTSIALWELCQTMSEHYWHAKADHPGHGLYAAKSRATRELAIHHICQLAGLLEWSPAVHSAKGAMQARYMLEVNHGNHKVHCRNLLEALGKGQKDPEIIGGIQSLGKLLAAIGERAILLQDATLNAIMCRMCIFTCADPESPDYDPHLTDAVIHPN